MKTIITVIILSLVLAISCQARGAESTLRTALILEFEGSVDVKLSDTKWIPAKEEMVLNQGDVIRTKSDSWALVRLLGDSELATVEIKENSQLRLAELFEIKEEGVQKTLLDLAVGEILIKAEKLRSPKSTFDVKTPTSMLGIRGTTLSVKVEALE
ncbi:MAG: FecR family protein [Candidatus Omnitrophota bacterium]